MAIEQMRHMHPKNFIAGQWISDTIAKELPVFDPATEEEISSVGLSSAGAIDEAVQAAHEAFSAWSATPVTARVQHMLRLRSAIEANADELARLITMDHGKTLHEARLEVERGLDAIDAACSIPMLLSGQTLMQVAGGIDTQSVREPVGVTAAITPFNFPMVGPLLFLAWALTCGNTIVVKPSERDPLAANFLFELVAKSGYPSGTANLVHGGEAAVNAILDHRDVAAVAFIGSAPVAATVYRRGAASGKRVMAAGGAKNHSVVMPDASLEVAAASIASSAFGSGGQRCMANSVAVAVGDTHDALVERIALEASRLVVGSGFDEAIDIGPVISAESKERIEGYIEMGRRSEGAQLILDGMSGALPPRGYFVGPTIFTDLERGCAAARDEIFGPVLTVLRAADLDEAIALCNSSEFGNGASIFTSSGASAREFARRVEVGAVGVNLGIPVPIGMFSPVGRKVSLFGQASPQGPDAVGFWTSQKSITSRWP